MLEQRSKISGLLFHNLMQADFVLYMKDCVDKIVNNEYQDWWPETLLYVERHAGPFEIFARAQSKEYFNNVKIIFGIKGKSDFEPVLQAFKEGKLRVLKWSFETFSPSALLGYEKLGTRE